MGIDTNYATFPSDVLNPHLWPNAPRHVPAIEDCWNSTGLVDIFVEEDPSRTAPTYFGLRAGVADAENPAMIPWPDLVERGLCRSYSRLDKLFTTPVIAAGASVEVLDCSPVYSDHRPVLGHFPALGLWRTGVAQTPTTTKHL